MPPHRRSRKSPGAKPLTSQREQYLGLMRQGTSNAAACRLVGVNRKTGHRWRYGRSVTTRTGAVLTYPAITGPADPVFGAYHPYRAGRQAAGRRVRPRRRKLGCNGELRAVVADHLERHWSPEQISRSLPTLFPDRPEMRAAPETIYQARYARGPDRLARDGVRLLRSGRLHRRRRRRSGERTGRFVAPMVMIDKRPTDVADRRIAGHWEGDLITGSANRSAIGTVVERTTRYLLLLHPPDGHGAERVRDALVTAVSALPARLRRSLTWDQGVEMRRHDEFTLATEAAVYFCEPHSPWQRGTNENTNGLLRQYFPKGTDLGVHTAAHLAGVAAELNARPRKVLGWETPSQQLDRLIASVP